MSLSQAMLTVADVTTQLADASEAVGHLSARRTLTDAQSTGRTDFLRASLTIDNLADADYMGAITQLYDDLASRDHQSAEALTDNERELKKAHALLLASSAEAGQYRSTGMGVYRNNRLVHMTAPANQIPKLLRQCLQANEDERQHPLVRAASLLFDLEFIQPFAAANGVVARLWLKKTLQRWHPFLIDIPFEQNVLARQDEYYQQLKQAIASNDNSCFIAFALQLIAISVRQLAEQLPNPDRRDSSEKNDTDNTEINRVIGSEKSSTREKLLALLEQQPGWSAARAAEVLGISSRAVEKHLSRLKRDGLLEREGSARAGRWRVTRPTTQQLSLPEY